MYLAFLKRPGEKVGDPLCMYVCLWLYVWVCACLDVCVKLPTSSAVDLLSP